MATSQWLDDNQDKVKSYRRDWYDRNRDHAIGVVKDRKRAIKEWLNEYKSKQVCSNPQCGETSSCCMEFHHLDPQEKDLEISRVVTNGWSIGRIQAEIAKCISLCSNCHKKVHAGELDIGSPQERC